MSSTHLHITAPARRGRPVPAYLRCTVCSKSTRSKKFVQCNMSDTPGGRICQDCYECHISDKSDYNCHSWAQAANSQTLDQCNMCAKKTDRLIPCIVCNGCVCEACINSATFERFIACGVYETICESCIPPEAHADQDGESAVFIGDRKCSFCLICQTYHEDVNDGTIDCDIDNNEHSPLARMCIDAYAARKAEKAKKSTQKAKMPMGSSNNNEKDIESASAPGLTAREIQRDNLLLCTSIQLNFQF